MSYADIVASILDACKSTSDEGMPAMLRARGKDTLTGYSPPDDPECRRAGRGLPSRGKRTYNVMRLQLNFTISLSTVFVGHGSSIDSPNRSG